MRGLLFSLFSVCCIAVLLAGAAQAAERPRPSPVPGGVAVLAFDGPAEPRAFYNGRRVLVLPAAQGWRAVVGIPLSAAPGVHQLELRWPSGREQRLDFEVGAKTYAVQRITIPDARKVNPTAADLERIAREREIARKAKTTYSDALPQLPFIAPVEGRFSSSYGLRRVLNGQPRSPHRGMDIAAAQGTPVKAPAPGRVLAVGDFFFGGNSVFLDHGGGLITYYAHLSRVDVKPGQQLDQGEVLGAVGMTGRATGPHLHWSVYLNATAVDPALFLPRETLAAGGR